MNVGDRIAGYEIVARLSSGGMATVYLGRRDGAGGFAKHVAIKLVHAHLAEDPTFVEMFLDEARLSARIEHPNVVHVHDLGEADGVSFLVMEYVAGCSLAQLLRAATQRGVRLTPEVAVAIAMKVASGLHAAHELTGESGASLGVVHRDVSPHNVLLAFRGHVKLIDFGVAKAAERSQQTGTALIKGKLRYMAPEQARGLPLDRRADIYALGIVLWEMLTSRRLFDGDNDLLVLEQVRSPKIAAPGAVVDGIAPALDEVVLSALAADPAQRPADAEVFRQRLATALPGALAIDAAHVAELLAVLVRDVMEASQKKLGTGVSGMLAGKPSPAEATRILERLAVPLAPPRMTLPIEKAAPAVARPAVVAGAPTKPAAPVARPMPPSSGGFAGSRSAAAAAVGQLAPREERSVAPPEPELAEDVDLDGATISGVSLAGAAHEAWTPAPASPPRAEAARAPEPLPPQAQVRVALGGEALGTDAAPAPRQSLALGAAALGVIAVLLVLGGVALWALQGPEVVATSLAPDPQPAPTTEEARAPVEPAAIEPVAVEPARAIEPMAVEPARAIEPMAVEPARAIEPVAVEPAPARVIEPATRAGTRPRREGGSTTTRRPTEVDGVPFDDDVEF